MLPCPWFRLLLDSGASIDDDEDPPPQFANCPCPAATAALYGREAILRTLLDKK